MFTIDTMPRVFSLNSGDLAKNHIPFLYCHIDLYLPSKAYGVSVYIEASIWLYLCTTLSLFLHRFPITKLQMIKSKYDLHALLKTEITNLFTNIYGA